MEVLGGKIEKAFSKIDKRLEFLESQKGRYGQMVTKVDFDCGFTLTCSYCRINYNEIVNEFHDDSLAVALIYQFFLYTIGYSKLVF